LSEKKDDLVKFYTGFSDYAMLVTFYEQVLEADARAIGIQGGASKLVVILSMAHALSFSY